MTKLNWDKHRERSLQQEGLRLQRNRKNKLKTQRAARQGATSKQMNYMRDLGIEIPNGCTKYKAIELLNLKLKDKKNKVRSNVIGDFFKKAVEQDLSGEWLKRKG